MMATLGGPTRFANIAMATGDFLSLFIELYCPFALQDQQLCALLQNLHEGHVSRCSRIVIFLFPVQLCTL